MQSEYTLIGCSFISLLMQQHLSEALEINLKLNLEKQKALFGDNNGAVGCLLQSLETFGEGG